MRLILVFCFCVSAVGLPWPPALAQTAANPAFARASHLRRGINASWWFAQMGSYSPQRLNTFITPTDFQLIHRLGFDHVRLPIDPAPLLDGAPANGLNADHLALLDNAVGEILENQLNVVLVIFPEDSYKSALSESPQAQQAFVRFWQVEEGLRKLLRGAGGQVCKPNPTSVSASEIYRSLRFTSVESAPLARVRFSVTNARWSFSTAGGSPMNDYHLPQPRRIRR